MTKTFPTLTFENGLQITYKVVANFRNSSITIYQRYGKAPYLKSYVSTPFLDREDIIKIMFEYDARDMRSFILNENLTCGKIRLYTIKK